MLDIGLIQRFNGVVNDQWFALFKYRAFNDKNLWNCICSAMDWITVSVEHINGLTQEKMNYMGSIETYAFLASVDIIVEAVQQLHRVLLDTTAVLYKNDRDVFQENRFNQTDLEYFKTLRACFGAHPVNLDEPNSEKKENKRRYASWSSTHKRNGTAMVILYSNQVGGKDIILEMEFAQVMAFAEKYYGYLDELIKELGRQKQAWFEAKRNEIIPKPTSPIEHLELLKEEMLGRIDNPCYESDIDEALLLLRTSVTAEKNKALVAKYQNALSALIDDIHTHLQNMDFSDCESAELLCLRPKGLPDGWGYWYSKISSSVLGGGYDPWYWEERIVEIFSPYFEPEYDSYEELYLLVNAALFDLTEKEKP